MCIRDSQSVLSLVITPCVKIGGLNFDHNYLGFVFSLSAFFGSTMIFQHFLHFIVLRGSYIGMKTLTLRSLEGCSRNILFTGNLIQNPQLEILFLGLLSSFGSYLY